MSLLGIDVGTTGAKAVVFSDAGVVLGSGYVEYDISRPIPGHAELDAELIWPLIKETITLAVATADSATGRSDPVRAIAVDSMGENLVPVSRDRQILGPSIMNMDARGAEFLPELAAAVGAEELYQITGNTLSNQFSIVKLMWMRRNEPDLYAKVDSFLPWNSFVSFMLGGDRVAEYALANRMLLFDVDRENWSDRMIDVSGLDPNKLPRAVAAGTVIGTVSRVVAEEIGLPDGIPIVIGAHDQSSASLGSGSMSEGTAMYGMGTFHCIAPVFSGRKPADVMISRGLNTEHYALPELYLTLIYNTGGSVVKWYRDTFAAAEHAEASGDGGDIYPKLFAELPERPSGVRVIPHLASMGPPDFIDQPNAAFMGMTLGTTRGDILKGIVEGNVFSLKLSVDALSEVGISIRELRPTGGGSKSDVTVQICADILGRPCVRPEVTEASALGSAILAGIGGGTFGSAGEAVDRMIRVGATFDPDMNRHEQYTEPYEEYKRLRAFVVNSRAT
ncbi:MAG: FGGY-family carbohydrate kinase [Spirochaetia bacterium]